MRVTLFHYKLKFFLCALLILIFIDSGFSQSEKKIIKKVWKGIGGEKAWEKTQYLSFTFEIEKNNSISTSRTHTWNRLSGDYRLETTQKDGSELLVLFNVNTRIGQAYINKKKVSVDSSNQQLITKAYNYFVNDCYWLLPPLRLNEPEILVKKEQGVILSNKKCYVLNLSFKNKSDLPTGDQHWLYIDKKTGCIVRWGYLLAGQKADVTLVDWMPYKHFGNLKFSTDKIGVSANFAVHFPMVKILSTFDPNIFTLP